MLGLTGRKVSAGGPAEVDEVCGVSEEEQVYSDLRATFAMAKQKSAKRVQEHLDRAREKVKIVQEKREKLSYVELKAMAQDKNNQIKAAEVQKTKQKLASDIKVLEAHRANEIAHIRHTKMLREDKARFVKRYKAAQAEADAMAKTKESLTSCFHMEQKKLNSDFENHRSKVKAVCNMQLSFEEKWGRMNMRNLQIRLSKLRMAIAMKLQDKQRATIIKLRNGKISGIQADQEWKAAQEEAHVALKAANEMIEKICKTVETNTWKKRLETRLNIESGLQNTELMLQEELIALEEWFQKELSIVHTETAKWMDTMLKEERYYAVSSKNLENTDELEELQDATLADIQKEQEDALEKIAEKQRVLQEEFELLREEAKLKIRKVREIVAIKAVEIKSVEEAKRKEHWREAETKREERLKTLQERLDLQREEYRMKKHSAREAFEAENMKVKKAKEIKHEERRAVNAEREEKRVATIRKHEELRTAKVEANEEQRSTVKRHKEELRAAKIKCEEEQRAAKIKRAEELRAAKMKLEEELRAAEIERNKERMSAVKQRKEELRAAKIKRKEKLRAARINREEEQRAAKIKLEELRASEMQRNKERMFAVQQRKEELRAAKKKREEELKKITFE